jgi:chemotaxis protein MotB
MARQTNAAPVIIKRKKNVIGGGHHGGAWKVAYADFVTAMMAFFMLMWLLNATTEKQRKGIADYFSPNLPVSRISGGGDGMFGGDSVFSEDLLAQSGLGGSSGDGSTAGRDEGAASGAPPAPPDVLKAEIDEVLTARSGESMTLDRALRHVNTRISDAGLVVEIFDLPDAPLFGAGGITPEPVLDTLLPVLADVLRLTVNDLAVGGHVAARPIVAVDNNVWNLSAGRAQVVRSLLEAEGTAPARLMRVTGHADRDPATADPVAIRNNRIEIILLRADT